RFFFSSRRRHTRSKRDWSSDVCSSDLKLFIQQGRKVFREVSPLVAETIQNHLESLSLKPEDLRRMWLHQANLNMNQLIARRVLEIGRASCRARGETQGRDEAGRE